VEIGGLALLSASAMDPSATVFQAIREIDVVLPASNISGRTPQRMACDLSRDRLEREFKFFNRLEGVVRTMCAPRGQRKSSNDQRAQAELNALAPASATFTRGVLQLGKSRICLVRAPQRQRPIFAQNELSLIIVDR